MDRAQDHFDIGWQNGHHRVHGVHHATYCGFTVSNIFHNVSAVAL